MTLLGIVGALFAFHNESMGVFFILMGYLAVGFPLDKWIDGHLKYLKIRSS